MTDGWTFLGAGGDMEFKIEDMDPKLFDILNGRKTPRHAADSTYYDDTLEAVAKIKPQWPKDKGRHIKSGSWTIIVQTWKNRPNVYTYTRHPGEPMIYTINMDKTWEKK